MELTYALHYRETAEQKLNEGIKNMNRSRGKKFFIFLSPSLRHLGANLHKVILTFLVI